MTFSYVFVGPDVKLGETNMAEHFINTGNAKPIQCKARRVQIHLKDTCIVNKEIDKMLASKVIEPCHSPWVSGFCLVKKKDKINKILCGP
jgi:hypothetical protein